MELLGLISKIGLEFARKINVGGARFLLSARLIDEPAARGTIHVFFHFLQGQAPAEVTGVSDAPVYFTMDEGIITVHLDLVMCAHVM